MKLKVYEHPALISENFPTDQSVITKAIKAANSYDYTVRDIRGLMAILKRARVAYPQVNSHIKSRKSLIAASDIQLVPIDPKDKTAADMAETAYNMLYRSINSMYDLYVSGKVYGAAIAELSWKQAGNKGFFRPHINRLLDPTTFEADDEYPLGIALLETTDDGKYERRSISNTLDYISYVNTENTEYGGELRTLIWAFFLLNLTVQEWNTYISFLKGIIQAKVRLGAPDKEKQAAKDAVETAAEDKVALTSELVDFVFHKITDGSADASFKNFHQVLQEDIERTLTGTTGIASDRERNAATVLERKEEDLAKWDRIEFIDLVNDELISRYWRVNYDKSGLSEPPFEVVFKPKLPSDRKTNHDMIMDFIGVGGKITIGQYEEQTGLNVAGEPEDMLGEAPETPIDTSGFAEAEPEEEAAPEELELEITDEEDII